MLIGINGGYFPAVCRVCFGFFKEILIGDREYKTSILAEIVILGSQFMTKFGQIFYNFLTDLIFLFLLFCFMVLFQDNHKSGEARFVWWITGWRLNGFPLRVVSEIFAGYVFDQFWSEWILKQEMKRVQNFGVFGPNQNWRVERKERFCSFRCFRESEK